MLIENINVQRVNINLELELLVLIKKLEVIIIMLDEVLIFFIVLEIKLLNNIV